MQKAEGIYKGESELLFFFFIIFLSCVNTIGAVAVLTFMYELSYCTSRFGAIIQPDLHNLLLQHLYCMIDLNTNVI